MELIAVKYYIDNLSSEENANATSTKAFSFKDKPL